VAAFGVAANASGGAAQSFGKTPATHLAAATERLNSIPRDRLDDEEAEEHFEELVRAYGELTEAFNRSATDPAARAIWQARFSTVERKLTALVGAGPAFDGATVEAGVATPVAGVSPPIDGAAPPGADVAPPVAGVRPPVAGAAAGEPPAGRPGPSGIAVEVSTVGIEDLDPAVRQQLNEFRRELELFFLAALLAR
jgi:hypothetical protein